MVNALILLGPLALLAALIAVPLYYLSHRSAPEPKRPLSLLRYLFATLGVGAAGYFAGAAVGIAVACSAAKAGNLCGLAGVFGTGPLIAAAAMLYYAHTATTRARQSR